MKSYAEELSQFRVTFALRASLESGGSVCRAAKATGIHRNTLTRWLRAGGYRHRELRKLVLRHRAGQLGLQPKKPVLTATIADSAQEVA